MLSASLVLFPLLMIYAACMDLFTMRISNGISIALTVGFLPLAMAYGLPPPVIGLHYSCGLFILLITFTMFAFGMIGGGDAKLAAASAIWMGFDYLLDYLIVASLLGGVLALALLAARRIPLPAALSRRDWIARLHDPNGAVPFGIALGLGGVIIYPKTSVWLLALGG